MALKAQKELEMKVHDEFYKNVYLLTLMYPPSKEFKDVFKKDMFVKNNKAGFQQVVYYLLNILDPDKLKQKVPTWPPYDLRMETQYRNEVMRYINELNFTYENANIPQLATSHVISPGGFKFVKFMFKLSQFVLFEHLNRNPEIAVNMLLPLKPSKKDFVTNENIEKIQIITSKINQETELMKKSFENHFESTKQEAQKIVDEQQEINKNIKENQTKLDAIKEVFNNLPISRHDEINMNDEIEKKLETLKTIKKSYHKCDSLNSLLNSSHIKLEYNNEIKIPSDISKIVNVENGILDLSSLLEGCHVLTDRKRLEVKPMTDQDILKQTEKFGKLNHRLALMNEDLDQVHSDLIKLSEKLQNESMRNSGIEKRKPLRPLQLTENDSDSTNSTVLAVPLSPSPSPNKKGNFNFDLQNEINFRI